jgi:hypothetical protein
MADATIGTFHILGRDKGETTHELGKFFTREHAEQHKGNWDRPGSGFSEVWIEEKQEPVASQHPSHKEYVEGLHASQPS